MIVVVLGRMLVGGLDIVLLCVLKGVLLCVLKGVLCYHLRRRVHDT